MVACEKDDHLCPLPDLPLNYFQPPHLSSGVFQRNIQSVPRILFSFLCLFQFVFAFSINMAPPVADPSDIEFSWLLMGLLGALYLVLRQTPMESYLGLIDDKCACLYYDFSFCLSSVYIQLYSQT